jgi:hypothetical protein
MPVRLTPLMNSNIHTDPPVIYDPDLELYLSVVEQRYSFYLGHRKIKGPRRWLTVNDSLPSNIVGHPVGGIDYVVKRVAFACNNIQGNLTFKLFNADTEIYNFNVNNQQGLHIDNVDLVVPNVIDFRMSVSTDYPNTQDYVDFPAVSVFIRRTYEEPPEV